MTLKTVWHLCKHAALAWKEDSIPRFSAALAFYTVFSLAPILTITIAASGLFFGRATIEGRIYSQVECFAGPATAGTVRNLVSAAWKPGKDLRAVVLGAIVLILGALAVLNELQNALHIIWRVRGPGRGAKAVLFDKARLLVFLMGVGFLLVVSLVFDASLAAFSQVYGAWLPRQGILLHSVDMVFEWMMILFVFAAIFKWLPDAEIAWRDVWTGSAVTSLLFLGGELLLSHYLGKNVVSSVYGAAGAFIVIMIWVYYSALVFYFGAEFTKVYADSFGSHMRRH